MAEGRSGLDARPATQACRAAGACAAKEGDVELAADVLAVVEAGPDDDAQTDASVVASCAAAFAVAGDVGESRGDAREERRRRRPRVGARRRRRRGRRRVGARDALRRRVPSRLRWRHRGHVRGGGSVRERRQRRGQGSTYNARSSCSARGARRTRAPPPRRRGWRKGARALEGKVSSSPAPGSPVAKGAPGAEGTAQAARGSPAVKEGTSFAFAAGARSKPAEKPSADSGADGVPTRRSERGTGIARGEASGRRRVKNGATARGKEGEQARAGGGRREQGRPPRGGGGWTGLGRRGVVQAAHRVVRELRSRVGGQGGAIRSSEQATKLGGPRGGGGQAERRGSRVHASRRGSGVCAKVKGLRTPRIYRTCVFVFGGDDHLLLQVLEARRKLSFCHCRIIHRWVSRVSRRRRRFSDVDEVTGRGLRRLLLRGGRSLLFVAALGERRRDGRGDHRLLLRGGGGPARPRRGPPPGTGASDALTSSPPRRSTTAVSSPLAASPAPDPGGEYPPAPRPTRQPRASRRRRWPTRATPPPRCTSSAAIR